ncbi:MAG: DUF4959 domain-containing protein [Niabella sp.]|nr:DUF4959 domain-containing protein [Niabella sp.]
MNKYSLVTAIMIMGFLFSCRKKDQGTQPGIWDSAPVEVSTVTPINGGATIAYKVPGDNDLLYVMAEYKRNGKMYTDKSSVYNNSLTIEGFDTIGTVAAKIYKVNKAGQRSVGTDVTFTPLQSLVSIAQNSLKFQPGFGGVVASWSNPKSTQLGVRFMYVDSTNKLTTNQMYFTAVPQELHAFRGFAPNPTKFAVSFEDKWGNSSDTVYYSTTPFFETLVPKPYGDYRANIPYDNTSTLPGGFSFSKLWDGIANVAGSGGNGFLTNPGNPGLSVTIDLKQVVKLSRIIIWGYHINSPYGQANFTQFELWGTNKIDPALFANKPYWLDSMSVVTGALSPAPANINPTTVLPAVTFKNDWQYMGWFNITRYDKMVPVDQQAILNLSQNGMEYTMPIDAKPVRYLRLFVRAVGDNFPPPANNYFSGGEISVYGDNTVPQQ